MNKLSLKLLTALAVMVGCTGSPEQVVTGRVGTGFPSTPTAVRIVQQGQVVATAPLAVDGSFRLAFPPAHKVALQVVTSGKTHVVFPRQAGGVQTTFAVRGSGRPFDLGTIHFVANASTAKFAFHNGPASSTECEDGKDSTGATCVDDADSNNGTCEQDNETEAETDKAEEQKADGGGSGSGASEADDDVSDGAMDEGDATADHNFPADGCADNEGDGSDGEGSGDK